MPSPEPEPPRASYRDGVGVARCVLCRRALRDPTDAPLVSVRRVDLAAVVRAWARTGDEPELARRLAQGLGLGLGQMRAGDAGAEGEEAGYGHGV